MESEKKPIVGSIDNKTNRGVVTNSDEAKSVWPQDWPAGCEGEVAMSGGRFKDERERREYENDMRYWMPSQIL